MNDKKFDSFIKNSLDGLSSSVPADMWKRIQAEKDFDPFVQQKLDNHSSAVPADMWQGIQNEKDFDVTIKEKLDKYSSPVPADMWQRIRPEEKKRRPIIWWWAAAASLLFVVGICASWYFKHQPTSTTISKNFITPAANSSQNNNNITALPNQVAGNTAPIQRHDSLTIPNANNPVSTKNPMVINDSSPFNQNNLASQNTTLGNKNIGNQKNTSKNNTTDQSLLNGSKTGNIFINHSIKNTYKNWQAKGNDGKNILNKIPFIIENGSREMLENKALLNSNTSSSIEKQLLLKNLIRSSLASNKLLPKQLLHVNAKIPSIVCPTIGPPKRNDWYVEAFLSPDFVVKKLQDKPISTNIKSAMDSTLHRQVSFSAGVNIVKSLGKNFLVKTGVQYAQVNELFKYNSGTDTRTTTVITVRDVIISPGDTIHIRDTSIVQQTGTITKQTQNSYKQWDIPLIFGYEFGNEGLRIDANLGLIANIRSSYQGNMLDTGQKVIDIANYNNTGVYKTNIGLGVYLGFGILKPLSENMDLLVEPHARFNLSNMTTQAAIFNQKNTIFGLSVGIRYKLNSGRQRH